MKSVVLTYIFLSCAVLFAASDDYDIAIKQLNVQSSEITYTLANYNLNKVNLDGQNFSKINFNSGIIPQWAGF